MTVASDRSYYKVSVNSVKWQLSSVVKLSVKYAHSYRTTPWKQFQQPRQADESKYNIWGETTTTTSTMRNDGHSRQANWMYLTTSLRHRSNELQMTNTDRMIGSSQLTALHNYYTRASHLACQQNQQLIIAARLWLNWTTPDLQFCWNG